MPSPKSTYSVRLSNARIKKLNYIAYKLTPKGQKELNRTQVIEILIDRMNSAIREGKALF